MVGMLMKRVCGEQAMIGTRAGDAPRRGDRLWIGGGFVRRGYGVACLRLELPELLDELLLRDDDDVGICRCCC